MSDNNISLKSIRDILKEKYKFFIPKYQRGYRWTKQQTEDLLNDLDEFKSEKIKDSNGKTFYTFYCLQPLVVREMTEEDKEDKKLSPSETWHEVIDGQQRLTTVFLILKYLKEEGLYELSYETREGPKNYLNEIDTYSKSERDQEKDSNIDFFHMCQAFEKITEWFDSFEDKKEEFLKKLLDNVKFIWYETDETKPIEVFTRLNIGKIPLTNAELIKALLLNTSNFSDETSSDKEKNLVELNVQLKQQEIAGEWDNIEKTLQDDEFWLFIHDAEYKKPTRIDFIFDLMCKLNSDAKEQDKENNVNDEYNTFRYFYNHFKEVVGNEEEKDKIIQKKAEAIEEIWSEVKEIFSVFKEWHDDLILYHYVGYLIDQGTKVEDLIKKWRKAENKEKFIYYLINGEKKKDKDNIKKKIEKCNNLNEQYEIDGGPDKTKCRPLLLLHNVQTVINQGKNAKDKYGSQVFYKFPFHIYKKEKWNIEHIDSNTPNEESKKDVQEEWLFSVYSRVKSDDLKTKIKDFADNKCEGDFEDLKNKITEELELENKSLTEEEKNQIMNFVLLDENTNKSFGNSIFSTKRRVVIGKDMGKRILRPKKIEDNWDEIDGESSFIAPCTKYAFEKYYNPESGDPNYWTKEDAEAYKKNILNTLKGFGVK